MEKQSKIQTACKEILKDIQSGDIVVSVGKHRWWQFWLTIMHAAIHAHQRGLFGRQGNWQFTHAMLYFDAENTFSIEMPNATMKPLEKYCLHEFTIYRLKHVELNSDYLTILKKAALEMVGENYDMGQMLDMAINSVLGFDHIRKLKIFDFGRAKKICSVGVRTAFEYLYQRSIKSGPAEPSKWLFQELNPSKWKREDIRHYHGTDVEATAPAHFANSDYYADEFEKIASFNNGVRIG